MPNAMITVTKVRATPDLGIVRVFLSFFAVADAKDALKKVQSKATEIRYILGKRIKDQVKGVPQLEFFLDDTNEYVDKMDRIFNNIQQDDTGEL